MMMLMRLRVTAVLLFGGIIMLLYGYSDYKKSFTVKAEPDRITCKAFDQCGPNKNNHVELVAFTASEEGSYICWGPPHSDRFTMALIPVYSKTRASEPPSKELRTILMLQNVHKDEALEEFIDHGVARGVVAGRASLLGLEAQQLLDESYPGIDFHACRIVKIGAPVPNAMRALGIMGGGVALLSCFGGYMYWSFKSGGTSRYVKSKHKVDTSSPEFMKKRIPTEMDPEKFRQYDKTPTPTATEAPAKQQQGIDYISAAEREELDYVSQSEEETAYRREFAERYGIGDDLMDNSDKGSDGDSWTPQSLNY